jgi:site-specific recombinase XerD
MSDRHLLGPFIRRFLLEDVLADRNLTLNTQRSYRDAICLLLRFLADRHSTEPTRVTVEQVTSAVNRSPASVFTLWSPARSRRRPKPPPPCGKSASARTPSDTRPPSTC